MFLVHVNVCDFVDTMLFIVQIHLIWFVMANQNINLIFPHKARYFRGRRPTASLCQDSLPGRWLILVLVYHGHVDTFCDLGTSINPLTAKWFNLNFHPLEVVSRWRDPQLQVSENYSDLTKWRSTVFKYSWLMSHFIFNMFKRWYLMC